MPRWTSRITTAVPRSMPVQVMRNLQMPIHQATGNSVPTNRLTAAPGSAAVPQVVKPLRMLSYNIQTGIDTGAYRHYVTGGWKHVLPHTGRVHNLRGIADIVTSYDFVALQEIDSGSLRSGFLNQVEYLAERAQFPYWYTQTNRGLGMLAQHGNGLLSRVAPEGMEDHKLPGVIPGRGAIVVRLPYAGRSLVVVLLHLSLGVRSREAQLEYVAQRVADEELVVIMGDMNCHAHELLTQSPLAQLNLMSVEDSQPTFPAWQPQVALDHILVSPGLTMCDYEVLDHQLSDHRPIGLTVGLAEQPVAA